MDIETIPKTHAINEINQPSPRGTSANSARPRKIFAAIFHASPRATNRLSFSAQIRPNAGLSLKIDGRARGGVRTKFFIILVAACAASRLAPRAGAIRRRAASSAQEEAKARQSKTRAGRGYTGPSLPPREVEGRSGLLWRERSFGAALALRAIDAGQGGVDPRRRHHDLAQGEGQSRFAAAGLWK